MDLVHSVGHSLVTKIVLQTLVRMPITVSPPALSKFASLILICSILRYFTCFHVFSSDRKRLFDRCLWTVKYC